MTQSSDEQDVLDDISTFALSRHHLPGTDRFSKLILQTPSLIDLIALELLDVPGGTYTAAGTEWSDGTRSDVLYVPRLGVQQRSLPPILIEVQLVVNEAFMRRLQNYGHKIFDLYKSYPLVLVFCTDRVSPTSLMDDFQCPDRHPWMYMLKSCRFWAQDCYLLTKTTLANNGNNNNWSPLYALSTFIIEQSPTLYGHSNPEHPTIRMLYRLAKECINEKMESERHLSHVLDVVCTNNEKLLQKLEKSIADIPGTSKARRILSSAFEFNRSVKRKYVELEDSDSSLEPLPPNRTPSRVSSQMSFNMERSRQEDDLMFIINFRKNQTGKMNWNLCLKEAHKNHLCKGFSTVEGIRSFFRRSMKTQVSQ
ncbi:hypothetical protein G6F70_005581 [Rhizopus microsporus]|uniref:Uncharacterized protein n=2 Tax=Rhizopus TaxID=4842 RepID=A0A367JEE9_RHIAZ|nr:hypothetical protein G6F71_006355 [Rhizopus microsporus]RCH88306.1 hypothetical protein CU097_010591 [Rhizopus azygosporus]KAG1198678.1 hypothetical protein G6F70_005581 [Rhizopus microsporus]KAG1210482.1 hypothetical protein G6F69_005431 [Rhizopus microsporus]KAG1230395.1 hypothetical protein G6F67_006483 [Rhizopus microsporus]